MLRSPEMTEVDIPADLLAELESLPDSKMGPDVWEPNEQEKAIILKFYKTKNKEALAKTLGICYSTLKKWHKILSAE